MLGLSTARSAHLDRVVQMCHLLQQTTCAFQGPIPVAFNSFALLVQKEVTVLIQGTCCIVLCCNHYSLFVQCCFFLFIL